jgi:hypothetical protein
MVLKSDPVLGELPKGRGIPLTDKVRPHTVPDEDNDVAIARARLGFAITDRWQQADQEIK